MYWFSAKWRAGLPDKGYSAIFGGVVCTAKTSRVWREGQAAETGTGVKKKIRLVPLTGRRDACAPRRCYRALARQNRGSAATQSFCRKTERGPYHDDFKALSE